MHDTNFLLANAADVERKLLRRGFQLNTEKLRQLETSRKDLQRKSEDLKNESNNISNKVAELIRSGNEQGFDVTQLKERSANLKESMTNIDFKLNEVKLELHDYLLTIPNLPSDKCPDGLDEETKEEISRWGTLPILNKISDHVEIGERLKILDIPRATKIAGARFSILLGAGARLERALISFLLDCHSESGYTEISVPVLVNKKSMTGTGQLPKFEEDLFKIKRLDQEDLYLVPTAEVPVTNYYSDEIIDNGNLPIAFACFSGCFRAEAGSYGRDTRGIIRQHQFNKIELVRICNEKDGWNELEKLRSQAEKVLQLLNLHYRVVNLPAGDIAFGGEFCYDLEVWMPSQDKFREVSSCSYYGTFQSRRCNIRTKLKGAKKTEFPATINGSALPIGRTIVAILEQNQRDVGSVIIPEVLRKYTGFSKILPGGKVE